MLLADEFFCRFCYDGFNVKICETYALLTISRISLFLQRFECFLSLWIWMEEKLSRVKMLSFSGVDINLISFDKFD